MNAAPTVRLGPFELLEPLGGGMAIVYRARRADAPDEFAVKILRQERLLDGDARERFAREVRALQRVSHPGICPVLDAGEVDGMPWLCMPLLRGRTLAAHCEAARQQGVGMLRLPGLDADAPPWTRIVEVGAAIADALAAAHAVGLVHRDVKPANVWIDDQGNPVLLDFGLVHDCADRLRQLTRTGQVVGTPAYLAPEQLDARLGPVDARADVHGLAAVLYEAVTLLQPFQGRSRAELFGNILTGKAADPRRHRPDLPADLAVLLEVALARRRRDRYTGAAAMAADLRRLLRGEPLAVRRPRWPTRLLDFAQRRPLRVALTAVLVGAVALGAGAVGRVVQAEMTARARWAHHGQLSWPGRLLLARAAHALLPPPWPEHRAALEGWLREHGRPLLGVSAAVASATPGLLAFGAAAVADVEHRLAFLAGLPERASDDGCWAAANAELAGDGRFAGFELRPLPGLVPLGRDPRSGLQEFYDQASGDPALPLPQRDACGGLLVEPRHGIVFVLLPGRRYTPAWCGEAVPLAPFLIAKHELTRAQHARLDRGHDPSELPLGTVWHGERQTERHPVNQILHAEVVPLLARWGLALPTGVQWEYAAMADGTDQAPALPGNYSGAEDGWLRTAPVGSFAGNAFGLHDMLGNVCELCADAAGSAGLPPRAADGLRDGDPGAPRRVVYGGGYGGARWQIAGGHAEWAADQRFNSYGVRPVRRLM